MQLFFTCSRYNLTVTKILSVDLYNWLFLGLANNFRNWVEEGTSGIFTPFICFTLITQKGEKL